MNKPLLLLALTSQRAERKEWGRRGGSCGWTDGCEALRCVALRCCAVRCDAMRLRCFGRVALEPRLRGSESPRAAMEGRRRMYKKDGEGRQQQSVGNDAMQCKRRPRGQFHGLGLVALPGFGSRIVYVIMEVVVGMYAEVGIRAWGGRDVW